MIGGNTRWTWRSWAALALIAWTIAYAWMAHGIGSPNERTRLYLSEALAARGELVVNDEIVRHGMLFDLSEVEGDYYCDKAPGSSVLALPAIAAQRALADEPPTIEAQVDLARNVVALPLALISALAFLAILAQLGVRESLRVAAALALWTGSALSHYAGAFYGHGLVTALSLISVYALLRARRARAGAARAVQHHVALAHQAAWVGLGSLAAAACFAVEYQAVVLCVGYAMAVLAGLIPRMEPSEGARSDGDAKRRAALVLACAVTGAVVPVLSVLAYNQAAFGAPLATSYEHLAHEVSVELHSRGLAGVTLPSLDAVVGLLFSASRGLFYSTPIFILCAFGVRPLWRRDRGLALYALAAVGGYAFVVSGTEVWMGGWSFGPRLLVPVYGFAGLFLGLALERLATMTSARRRDQVLVGAALGLGLAGAIICQLIYLTAPEISYQISAPLSSIALPMLREGLTSPNVVTTFSAARGWSTTLGLALPLLTGWLCVALWIGNDERGQGESSSARKARPALLIAGTCLTAALFVVLAIATPQERAPDAATGFVDNYRDVVPQNITR